MQILTFILGKEKFAVDISLVDTIENKMSLTTVPKAKKYVTGLISTRGTVIPVINTSLILDKKEQINVFEKLIIINLGNNKFALEVDEIDDVLDINTDDIKKVNGNENLSVIKVNSNIITLLTYNELSKI